VISGAPLKSTSMQAIVSAMVGHAFNVGEKILPVVGAPVLALVGAARRTGDPEVSITVHACEILGIAGLAGSGAEEIGAMLAGALVCSHGALNINGRPVGTMGDRAAAVAAGIGYVPADRSVDGLFPGHNALRNASASVLDHLTKFGLLSRRAESIRLSAALTDVSLTPNQPQRLIDEFSGGNQQKVLLARNLAVVDIKALVLVEPTRGVDVGARDIIHDRILKAAAEGLAVVLVSTDLEELTSLSHRVAIVRDRRLTTELPRLSSPAAVAGAMLGESQ
jgi:ribose transport system ATP-binding protein/rhamnose transport system ATP-binding protein